MIPIEFRDFFVGSVGASAALIGLLFVAVSVRTEQVFGPAGSGEQESVAESAFAALVTAFIISLVALIPHTSIGGVVVTMGLFSLWGTLAYGRRLVRQRASAERFLRRLILSIGSVGLYIVLVWSGVLLLRRPEDDGIVYFLSYLLIALYGVGLARAWEVLGARRKGLLSGLLARMDDAERPEHGNE
ncbi:MAG: hypothetical protein ACR2M3_17180 [Thermomicrobiales bacterium]